MSADAQHWSPFATIQTDPYENWLGDIAKAHGAESTTDLAKGRDLAEPLTGQYRALGG